jgi:hypothetical protein
MRHRSGHEPLGGAVTGSAWVTAGLCCCPMASSRTREGVRCPAWCLLHAHVIYATYSNVLAARQHCSPRGLAAVCAPVWLIVSICGCCILPKPAGCKKLDSGCCAHRSEGTRQQSLAPMLSPQSIVSCDQRIACVCKCSPMLVHWTFLHVIAYCTGRAEK